MANKKTYIYKLIAKTNNNKVLDSKYFYARNTDELRNYYKNNFNTKYDCLNIVKLGEHKYVNENPVQEFTEQETETFEKINEVYKNLI